MAIVYEHLRNDTNEVFYVGIGKTPRRAFSKHGRTGYWKKLVNKYGYTVNIKVNDATWDEAIQIEKYLIAFYGRKDLGLGSLVNMTDGGQGTLGIICSKETKKKIGEANKGEKNAMFGKPGINLGKNITEEHKKKIRESNTGKTFSKEHKNKIGDSQRNKEGVKGYSSHKASNKYQVRIRVSGKRIYIGLFNTPSEAEEAYKQAKKIHHII